MIDPARVTQVKASMRGELMQEEEVRLALLQTELSSIQNSIRSFETIIFQIKGWCVTTSLAVGGFAIVNHIPALILIGEGAVLGFFLINCQFKMYQHRFLVRNDRIDSELKDNGIMEVLKGAGSIDIVGTTAVGLSSGSLSISARVRRRLPDFLHEAQIINTFSLYVFITFCYTIEAIILLS